MSRPTTRRLLSKICQIHALYELKRERAAIVVEKPSMDFAKFRTEYMIERPLMDWSLNGAARMLRGHERSASRDLPRLGWRSGDVGKPVVGAAVRLSAGPAYAP